MKSRAAAKESLVIHANMSGQKTIIGDDHIIADGAVMSDVGAHHQKIVVAERCSRAVGAATMNGTMFANDIVVPDLNGRSSGLNEREILGRASNDAPGSNHIAATNPNEWLDDHVRPNNRPRTNMRVRPDNRVWSDLRVRRNFRSWIDDRTGVNAQRTPASLKLK